MNFFIDYGYWGNKFTLYFYEEEILRKNEFDIDLKVF